MTAIAKLSHQGRPVGLADVSRHSSISRRYLEQLVGPLKNASLLRSISGRGGGYALTREPDDISVGDVIRAAAGPIAVTECVEDPESCILTDYCNCRYLWIILNEQINSVLNDYSLADLLDENWQRKMKSKLRAMEARAEAQQEDLLK